MMSIVRSALVALAIYFAVTYYVDDPDARGRLVAGAEAADAEIGDTIFDAKNRLDSVKGRVQDGIALGSERISRAD